LSVKKGAIVIDLDGTLQNVDHRVKHVQKEPKDWKAFNSGLIDDPINKWCLELINAMGTKGYRVILLTGRSDRWRDLSVKWLKDHDVSFEKLFMRPHLDMREDHFVKESIYLNEIEPEYDVLFVVEDRLSVVKMWRKIGVTCLQCDWGDF